MCDDNGFRPLHVVWGRNTLIMPRDHLVAMPRLHQVKKFQPSYDDKCLCQPSMQDLMSGQYQRIWRSEVDQYHCQQKAKGSKQLIKNDVNFNKNRFAPMRKKLALLAIAPKNSLSVASRVDHKRDTGGAKAVA